MDSSATASSTQNGFYGTLTIVYKALAQQTDYSAGSPSNWYTLPLLVSTALDYLSVLGNSTLPTAGQFLIENSGATLSTWTTISGDVSASTGTPGSLTVTGLQSISVPSPSGTNTVLTYNSGAYSWSSPGGGSVTWADDLSSSTSTDQWVSSISGASGGGGTVALNITTLQFGSSQSTLTINQATTSSSNGTSLTIQAQDATGSSNNGGNLILSSGTSGAAAAGNIQLQVGAATFMEISNHGLQLTETTTTSSYSVDSSESDYFIFCNPSAGITITLPSPTAGRVVVIKDISGTAETNNITIARFNTENIEGLAASYVLTTNWGCVKLSSDGTNWFIVK